MQGLKDRDATLSTWVLRVSRLGVLCALSIMAVGLTGCQPMVTTCDTSADCADGQVCGPEGTCIAACTMDSDCAEGEVCNTDSGECEAAPECTTDADCPEGEVCNDNGECEMESEPECVEDADCDDSDNCTTDACGDDGTCSNTAVECPEGESCDAETGECVADMTGCTSDEDCMEGEVCNTETGECEAAPECTTDEDCMEGEICNDAGECEAAPEPCTTDEDCAEGEVCNTETGECEAAPDMCTADEDCEDDGVFCNGDEVCNTETGECESSGNPCPEGQDCNEDTDACEGGTACDTDADCEDDGLFCTGTESCGPDGFCVSSGDPCAENETCNEDLNSCDEAMGETIDFTVGVDDLSGTGDADTFRADVVFNAPTATFVPTLSSSDRANGGDGTDSLSAFFEEPGANLTVSPELISIENINITDRGTAGGNATTFSMANVTGATRVASVNSTDDACTINNVGALVNMGITNTASDFLITFTGGLGTASDAATLSLDRAKAGCTATITTPANGLETLTVDSGGTAANRLDALTQATGTTLTTLNVTGDMALTVTNALNAELTTLNAGENTGGTSLTVQGAQNITYTGGNGDDYVNFAGTYTNMDTINGGMGSNSLGLNSAQAVGAVTNQSNVSNINMIRVVDALNGALDVRNFGANNARLDMGLAANSTITTGTTSPTVTIDTTDTGANTLGITVPGAGTSDTLTLNVQNADQGATLTCTGAETVSINSTNGADGTAADGAANTGTAITLAPTFGTGQLSFTGDVAFTLTGAITAGTIDASALGGALTMGATTAVSGVTVNGSASADTLFGSAGSDVVNGNGGNDSIRGVGNADILDGGDGNDTHVFEATAAANGADIVNNFGAGDILDFTLFATDNAPTATVSDTATGNQAVANNNIFIVTDADGSTDTAAEVAALFGGGGKPFAAGVANMQVVLLIVDTQANGDTTIWYIDDADANTTVAAGECVQVATLTAFNGSSIADANITD